MAGRGFTLIELLVVVAIMGLLAGLMMPVIGIFRRSATITRSEALLQMVHTGLVQYRELYRSYPPTEPDPITDNRLAFYLCADRAEVTPSSRRSSMLLGRIAAESIQGDAIVDPFDQRPLIYISTTSGGALRSTIDLPTQLGSDASDSMATAYRGYERVFELWSAGPDRGFAAIRNDPVNTDNLSITAPFGTIHAH